ncbi:MAG: hypothetical protein ACHREM_15295 [Polyangiales bacterium]
MSTSKRAVITLALSTLACGARSGFALPAPGPEVSSVSDAATTLDAGVDVVDSSFESPTSSARCDALAAAIAAKIVPSTGSCTTVVRLDGTTMSPIAYQMICGAHGATNESEALKQAISDTGIPGAGCFGGASVSGATPADEYVFFAPASAGACACCGDGWVGAVSARTGLTVLGGAITIGSGDGLIFPKSWSPASELGSDCPNTVAVPTLRGWNVTELGGPASTPPTLDAATLSAAANALQSTALLQALAQQSYLFDGVVLKYVAQVGGASAEVIVLLNSGWLE